MKKSIWTRKTGFRYNRFGVISYTDQAWNYSGKRILDDYETLVILRTKNIKADKI